MKSAKEMRENAEKKHDIDGIMKRLEWHIQNASDKGRCYVDVTVHPTILNKVKERLNKAGYEITDHSITNGGNVMIHINL